MKKYTLIGIIISYATISGVNWIFKTGFEAPLGDVQVVARELIILTFVGVLFLVITKGEKLGFDSIGLHFKDIKKSLIFSVGLVALLIASILIAILISQQLGWKFGESKSFDKLSLLTITLVVIRAGIAEEVFMRGYLLERLEVLTENKIIAAFLSLIPFALFHYSSQGWAGVLISFAAGAVLTWSYLWKRDLKANIFAHFIVDFIPNVLIPLVS